MRSKISCLLLLAACVGLTACGAGDSGGTDAANTATVKTLSSGCGSAKLPAAKDPDGVLAALPASYRTEYAGYPTAVRKSPWSTWKPSHGPPYKVAVSWGPMVNDFQIKGYQQVVQQLKSNPDISVIGTTLGNSVAMTEQLQQVETLLREKPDILIFEPLQPTAAVSVVERAAKASIPTLSVQGGIPTPHSLNVQSNNPLAATQQVAAVAQLIHGRG